MKKVTKIFFGVWLMAILLSFAIGSAQAQAEAKININTAPVEVLQTLPGIGPALAEKIVIYRTETPFTSIEDITQVSGIGQATFEKFKDMITVE